MTTETLRPAPGAVPARPVARDRRLTIVRKSALHRGIVWGAAGLFGAAVLYAPFYYTPFQNFRFALVMVYAIGILGLNLLTGYNGQISLGHSAFFGVGAYTSAVLIYSYHWPYIATLPVAAALTFAAGFLFGIPALRLKGHVLALVTLSLAVAFVPLIKRFSSITGGSQGRHIKAFNAPGWTGLENDQWRYFFFLGVTVIMFLLARNLVNGRIGRALVSIRDNEVAAQTMGVHASVFKSTAFAFSAMYAGVAGVLYVLILQSVSPEAFTLTLAIAFLVSMVVGGLATISGAIFGGLFQVYIFVAVDATKVDKAWSGVVYGVLLILVMFLMPTGVVGLLRKLRDLFIRFEAPKLSEGITAKELEHVVTAPTGAPAYAGVPDEGAWSTSNEGGS